MAMCLPCQANCVSKARSCISSDFNTVISTIKPTFKFYQSLGKVLYIVLPAAFIKQLFTDKMFHESNILHP